jgi:hypothetical protein
MPMSPLAEFFSLCNKAARSMLLGVDRNTRVLGIGDYLLILLA